MEESKNRSSKPGSRVQLSHKKSVRKGVTQRHTEFKQENEIGDKN